jgi:hypothetical protein
VAAQLAASQEWLSSKELVSYYIIDNGSTSNDFASIQPKQNGCLKQKNGFGNILIWPLCGYVSAEACHSCQMSLCECTMICCGGYCELDDTNFKFKVFMVTIPTKQKN